jgi:hypothetical protein
MSGLTRSKIAYDLRISPHTVQVLYETCNIKFVFSSGLYKRNFLEKIQTNREKINGSISNRFGFSIKNDILSDLKLYTTIEKRGFLIYKDGEEIECLSSITLDGNNLIMTS